MRIFTDLACCAYESPGHPERPYRVRATDAYLKKQHADWEWAAFEKADRESLLLAHSEQHLNRLQEARHFDPDTDYHDGIFELAQLSCGAGLSAMESALEGEKAFSLMRPPGHHAEREQAMGFCYLNNIAICALVARERGVERIALWDFDAHHGNGSEAILKDEEGMLYVSIHQHPCYPGTGSRSDGNCLNYPVLPLDPPEEHMEILRESWNELLAFQPQLILVSAGFDAYESDPVTQMTLRKQDFAELGSWLGNTDIPAAALLEGGYSDDLPQLVDAFLTAWEQA